MAKKADFEKYIPFLSSQARDVRNPSATEPASTGARAITISRESGSGAHQVATCLAKHLQACNPPDAPAWSIFDGNLITKVLEEHNLPLRLARYIPEDRIPEVTDIFDELLGFRPPAWTLVQQTTETVLRLARAGNVILIGRGAHVITRGLAHVFHVRLVGSLDRRVEHYREMRGISRDEALNLIRREDRGRRRYLKKYFGCELENPLAYHMTINTDSLPYERVARLLADGAMGHGSPPAVRLHQSINGIQHNQVF